MPRPRLKYLGHFSLSLTIKHASVVLKMALRRRIEVTVDDPRGVRSWRLTYKVLPGTPEGPIELDGDEGIGAAATLLPRATYVWDFFNARKGGEVKSFIITCPRDGKDYLVVFEDTELTLETFNVRLYSTGLTLVQVDEPDMPTNEDGSLDLEE